MRTRLLFLIAPCLLLIVILYTLAGAEQMPMVLGFGTAVVQSGSMEPTLSVDDLLFVKEESSYDVGDIVVYRSGNMLVVHRITEISGDTVTAQGDANNTADEPFDASEIRGRVVGRIPAVGRVVGFLKTPFCFGLLMGGAALLLLMSFRREEKEE